GGAMTPRERLAMARRRILATLMLRALLHATVAALAAVALLLLFDVLIGLPQQVRAVTAWLPWLLSAAALAVGGWRAINAVHGASDEALALWFERRIPDLQYALVTRVGADIPTLDARIAAAPLEAVLTHASRGALKAPALVAVIGAVLLW